MSAYYDQKKIDLERLRQACHEDVKRKLSFIETKQTELKADIGELKSSEKTHDAVAEFVIQAMKSLEELQKSTAARALGWGQELNLTKEGVDLMAEATRTEKIFQKIRDGLDAEQQVVEEVEDSLTKLGRMTLTMPVEVVTIDDAEQEGEKEKEPALGSMGPGKSKSKEMSSPSALVKRPETKKAPFPPSGKLAVKKEQKEEKIKTPEQKKMPKAPAKEKKSEEAKKQKKEHSSPLVRRGQVGTQVEPGFSSNSCYSWVSNLGSRVG